MSTFVKQNPVRCRSGCRMEQSQTESLYIVRRKRQCIVIHNGNELDWRKLKDVKAGKFTPYVVDIETANQLANDFGGRPAVLEKEE